jgi:hypothetical protein
MLKHVTVDHVTIDPARRALLGAAGALILQTVLRPGTALSQTAPVRRPPAPRRKSA